MSSGINYDWVYYYTVCTGVGDDETCTDHYQYICEGDPPPIDEEVIDFIDPGDGGGGGGPPLPTEDCNGDPNGTAFMSDCGCIGGNTGISSCDPLEVIFCEDISPQLREAIMNHIKGITDSCAINFIVQKIDEISGFTLQICIDDDPEIHSGVYSTDGKITFRTDYTATNGFTMQHELFHAYQDKIAYNNGISQYADTLAGKVNIEFEQALFADIIYGTNMFDYVDVPSVASAYETWRNTLTNYGTTYPNLSDFANYQSQYLGYLHYFDLFHRHGKGMAISLEPEALKLVFSGLQKNCGS